MSGQHPSFKSTPEKLQAKYQAHAYQANAQSKENAAIQAVLAAAHQQRLDRQKEQGHPSVASHIGGSLDEPVYPEPATGPNPPTTMQMVRQCAAHDVEKKKRILELWQKMHANWRQIRRPVDSLAVWMMVKGKTTLPMNIHPDHPEPSLAQFTRWNYAMEAFLKPNRTGQQGDRPKSVDPPKVSEAPMCLLKFWTHRCTLNFSA